MPDKHYWTVEDLNADEIANIKGKRHPYLHGKLRLLRENFPNASVVADIVSDTTDASSRTVIVRAVILDVSTQREAQCHGAANSRSDADLADSLVELAESRAIARAARFFGLAMNATSAEEVQGRKTFEREEQKAPRSGPKAWPGSGPNDAQVQRIEELIGKLADANIEPPPLAPPSTPEQAARQIAQLERLLK
jgi:hypothetical protein